MSKEYHSFTIRVPRSLYFQLADLAKGDHTHLSGKVNELILIGLGRQLDFEDGLRKLLGKMLILQQEEQQAEAA